MPPDAALAESAAQTGIGGTDPIVNALIISIIITAGGGFVLMVAGSLLKRRAKPPEN